MTPGQADRALPQDVGGSAQNSPGVGWPIKDTPNLRPRRGAAQQGAAQPPLLDNDAPLFPDRRKKRRCCCPNRHPPLCSKEDRDREGESDPSKGHTDAPHPARSLKLASFPGALNERKQLP